MSLFWFFFVVSLSQWKRSVGIKALWIIKRLFFSHLLLPQTFSLSSLKLGPASEDFYTAGSCTLRCILNLDPSTATSHPLSPLPYSPWSTHTGSSVWLSEGCPLGKGQKENSPLPPPVLFQLEPPVHTVQTGRRAGRDSTPAWFGYPAGWKWDYKVTMVKIIKALATIFISLVIPFIRKRLLISIYWLSVLRTLYSVLGPYFRVFFIASVFLLHAYDPPRSDCFLDAFHKHVTIS